MCSERFVFLFVLVALPPTLGCGDSLASVSGTVTLDGQPVGGSDRYGTVSFYREAGGGAPAIGIIDSSGNYTLNTGSNDGVEPGTYLVGISVKHITPPASQDAMPQATPITPARYASVGQSGFRHEVKPGRNTIDFDLSSKGP
jgi:hypothetical protein